MKPELLLWLVIVFVVAEYLLAQLLDYLNTHYWSPEIPAEMKDYIDSEKYDQARKYDLEKKRLHLVTSSLGILVILAMLLTGAFGKLDLWVRQFSDSPVWIGLMYFGILFFSYDILSLPISIYNTFSIEQRFGFNKMTPALFIIDKLKGMALTIIIGGGLLALIIFIYTVTGKWFWLIAWEIVTVFTLFITIFYTSVLVPIFNKLTPLQDSELRHYIRNYADKVNFPLKNIMVMDGSKRSTKSNAYFSGLGAKKTIVLFDTLMENHSKEELVAILAHEVGHYKKKHVRNNLILSVLQTGVLLFIFGQLADSTTLAAMLGAEVSSFHIGLLGFTLLFNPISLVLGILMNIYSRKNEFEADAFAKETYDALPLKTALKKLSVHNLSNFRPHPAYVFFHYSHPPLLDRLKALS